MSVACLALAAVVAGCTGNDEGGTAAGSASAPQAVQAFMVALGNKDAASACAQVSTGGKALADTGLDQCKEGLQKVIDTVTDPAELDQLRSAVVTGANVDGDKATVSASQITKVPQGYANDIDLVRINGRWFIDSKT